MVMDCTNPKFSSGKVVVTKEIAMSMKRDKEFEKFCWDCLHRHVRGDWGDTDDVGVDINEMALKGMRTTIHSLYDCTVGNYDGEVIYVVTDPDRSHTTIMFAGEF